MNETLIAAISSVVGAIVMRTVDSYLKRGESKSTDELQREKLDHEQEVQLRSELRQEIKELRERVTTTETNNIELRRKVIELEKDVALKDTQITILQNKVEALLAELDKFNKKVYYIRKEGEN